MPVYYFGNKPYGGVLDKDLAVGGGNLVTRVFFSLGHISGLEHLAFRNSWNFDGTGSCQLQ